MTWKSHSATLEPQFLIHKMGVRIVTALFSLKSMS